jgi:hypothetical protein
MSFIRLVQNESHNYEHRCNDVDQKSTVFWDITPCMPMKVPEDSTLHNHRRENLKTYMTGIKLWFL